MTAVLRYFAEVPLSVHPAITRFTVERPEPAYLALHRSGELQQRALDAIAELSSCRVCPRNCEVDRLSAVGDDSAYATPSKGKAIDGKPRKRVLSAHIPTGAACFTGRYARVSTWFAHFGEERCLQGTKGSGTIFLSFCNLRCVFCQNWDTSQAGVGVEVTAARLADAMLDLQRQGCHNINWVTPEHVVPQLLEALVVAVDRGLRLPIVYNTSGYDSLRSLQLMDGVVDIYMPDFKYADAALAQRFVKAADYPEVATKMLREMFQQVGPLTFDADGLAVRGVLLRHLVMPDATEDAAAVMQLVASVSKDIWVNVMAQYHPDGQALGDRYTEIRRRPVPRELHRARDAAKKAGLWRLEGLV